MPDRLTTAVAKVPRLRIEIVKRFVVLPRRWVMDEPASRQGL
jgi:hypothetical protein